MAGEAEINLGNISHNIKVIKSIAKNKLILLPVKANAYGHGMIPVARQALKSGVEFLGVADIEEAEKLYRELPQANILVLGAATPSDLKKLPRNWDGYRQIRFTVGELSFAKHLSKLAARLNRKIKIHVKIDTGMGRIGIPWFRAEGELLEILNIKNLEVEGVYTHFPDAESDPDFTREQIKRLKDLKRKVKKKCLWHAANTAAVFLYKESHLDMVRPGIGIYGASPDPLLKLPAELKPVLKWKAKVAFVKRVPPGYSISYGRTYFTWRSTYIATVGVGYHDGYPRCLSNRAFVIIKNRRFPVVGRVTMDQIMIETGNFKPRVGEDVILIGNGIKAEDLAMWANTCTHEILSRIGSRVKRIYIESGG